VTIRTPFAGLLTAEGISILGTRMSTVAVPWLVLTTTGSATKTGLVAFAEMLPYVLVMALGGPIIDRWGARRISLVCDTGAAVAVGLIPLAWAAGLLHFGVLLALIAVVGAGRASADGAKRLLIPALAERSGVPLERATGLHDGVSRVAGLVGAPVAGALAGLFGAASVLVVDAVSFVAAAVLLGVAVPAGAVALAAGDEPARGVRRYFREIREGLSWLRRHRLMCGIAAMVSVTNLMDAAFATVLAPLWANEKAGNPLVLGLIFGVTAGGAVAGNVAAAVLGPRLPRYRTYAWGFLLCGAPRFAALWLLDSVPLALAVTFVGSIGAGVLNPILGAVEFESVPRELQARVLGAVGALAWAGIPVGGLLAGWLAGAWGLGAALALCGAVYLAATLAPFVFPSWKQMDRAPAPDPVPASY
jgi:MFS family permease